MILQALLGRWARESSFNHLRCSLDQSRYRAVVHGLEGSARAYFMAALAGSLKGPVLVVAADTARAEKIFDDLLAFMPRPEVHFLPSRELFVTGDLLSMSIDTLVQRHHFYEWASAAGSGIYVAPVEALLPRVVPAKTWRSLLPVLQPGLETGREKLLESLVELGYRRCPLVEGKGFFSVRGEIVDLFPPGRPEPVRIELFEDTIASIRTFDPQTQRSTGKVDRIRVLPAWELFLPASLYARGRENLRRETSRTVTRLRRARDRVAGRLENKVEQHLLRLGQPGGLEMLAGYFPFFYGPGAVLWEHLPPGSLIIFDEPVRMEENAAALHRELIAQRGNLFLQGELLPSQLDPIWTLEEMLARLVHPAVAVSFFPGGRFKGEEIHFAAKEMPHYHGQWELFYNDAERWLQDDFEIVVLASNTDGARSLTGLFREHALPARFLSEQAGPDPEQFRVAVAGLGSGFVLPGLKLAVVCEANLVPRRRKKKRLVRREGVALGHYRELGAGDYVVHEQHGIGKYLGLSTLEINDVKKDFLQIKYRGTDKLYLPVEQVHLIQKYVGEEGKAPRLHSLGGAEWQRLKTKVKASVQEMARNLLALYAARETVSGYAFGPDHPWQGEFETRFPYEETPDQLRAIAEVKADMEQSTPMDRLVCGDVGYGKTEVALRAAFKAALEGKQVALLVPTTILAQQHYRTFSERFRDFPLQVAQLSRFVSASRQKDILEDLARGKVDIVIGTHRLLSADVRFHDLGLLIIDEEQRFGVRHKEKLKQMRLEVDVLAMTATPIPRTLHLSMAGVRNLSVIETPPENRYPVQTFVVEYSDQLVWEAFQRELNRRGQVYFVFNRVRGIEAMAAHLQELFPAARIAVGHGRMSERRLEKVMNDFLEERYDVLVSTTIVEAGLDIPNVNTMIVYDADNFGLAQLYQLRGRVGRSNRLAYAYLTYRREKMMTALSQKRLQAITEFTELGSGFKIALRDLEIRGAGNILGAEQHGFMVAVGFDLYLRLLEQAVRALRREPVQETVAPEPRLDLQVNAFLPSSYIASQDQKIDFYQRIYAVGDTAALKELETDLRDRYGQPPRPVHNLLTVARLRLLASRLGVDSIRQEQGLVVIRFARNIPAGEALWVVLRRHQGRVTLCTGRKTILKMRAGGMGDAVLPGLVVLLEEVAGALESPPENAGAGMVKKRE